MTREEKLKYCRYYKGEDNCPYKDQNEHMFWFLEQLWTEQDEEFKKTVCENYKCCNGKSFKGVPYDLIATIFTSWGKYAYDISKEIETGFYPLIEKEYLASNNTQL